MPKSKTNGKKYTPRTARTHGLITAMNSFSAFEGALQKLIDTGEATLDEHGISVYKDATGRTCSYAETLKVYIGIIEIYALKRKLTVNVGPLEVLRLRLTEMKFIDEGEVDAAKKGFSICKQIMREIKATELTDIVQTLRIRLAQRLVPTT